MAGAVVHGAHRAGRERISADPVGPLLPVRATAACRTLRVCVRNRSSLRSLCRSFSFAPSGLAQLRLATHGLRRGLHSYAASRLDAVSLIHFSDDHRAMTQTPPGLESFLPLFPALKRWAKLGRPSGAAFSCAWFHQAVRKRVLTHTLKRCSTQKQVRHRLFAQG